MNQVTSTAPPYPHRNVARTCPRTTAATTDGSRKTLARRGELGYAHSPRKREQGAGRCQTNRRRANPHCHQHYSEDSATRTNTRSDDENKENMQGNERGEGLAGGRLRGEGARVVVKTKQTNAETKKKKRCASTASLRPVRLVLCFPV